MHDIVDPVITEHMVMIAGRLACLALSFQEGG